MESSGFPERLWTHETGRKDISLIEQFKVGDETYVDKLDAMELLGVAPHPEIVTLLTGLFATGSGVRLAMVRQLENERVLGRLIHRGPNLRNEKCDCSDHPVWCSRADRLRFLREVVDSLPFEGDDLGGPADVFDLGRPPRRAFHLTELLETIATDYPGSCLSNQYCFELTFTHALIQGTIVRISENRFETSNPLPSAVLRKLSAVERREREAHLAHFKPHVNHYRERTGSD